MAKSKKVNKWEAAPESIKQLHNAFTAFTAFDTMSYAELDDNVDWDELDEWLEKVLKDYNDLEAKHNADCGLISKLEEENKNYGNMDAQWDCENGRWRMCVKPSNIEVEGVSFDIHKFNEGYNKLWDENKMLISARESWRNEFLNKCTECDELKKENKMLMDAGCNLEKCRSKQNAAHMKLIIKLKDSGVKAIWDDESETWELQCSGGVNLYSRLIGNEIWINQLESENGKLKEESEKLKSAKERITDKCKKLGEEIEDLNSKNRSWQIKYNDALRLLNFELHEGTPCGITNCPKVEQLTAERDGLNDYTKVLKDHIQELEDRSKEIYRLARKGYNTREIWPYIEIADKTLCARKSWCPYDCLGCKNYEPRGDRHA